jgi:hypothetical protein
MSLLFYHADSLILVCRWQSLCAKSVRILRSKDFIMKSAAVMGRNTMTYQTILFQRRCANDLIDAAQTRMRSLSLSQQQAVIDFIEFLASKQVVERDKPQDKSLCQMSIAIPLIELRSCKQWWKKYHS